MARKNVADAAKAKAEKQKKIAIGLIVILGLLVTEHILARRRDLRWVNAAFFKLNAVISMLFLAVTAVEVVFPWFRLRWY